MRKFVFLWLSICWTAAFQPASSRAVELYLEHRFSGGGAAFTAFAFGPEGGTIAYGNSNGEVFLADLPDGEPEVIFRGPHHEITAVAFSPDGRTIAAAPKGRGVWLINRRTGSEGGRTEADAGGLELNGAGGRIGVLEFSGDGKYLAAAGDKKEICIWEIPSGQLRSRLKGHDKEILAVAFDDSERQIISVGKDSRMVIWDAPSGKLLRRYELEARTMPGSGVEVTAAGVNADRLFVAAAVDEHLLRKGGREMLFEHHIAFFDVSKGVLLKILEDNNRKIEHLALYPGNCFVAFDNSTLRNGSIALRNIESGSLDLAYPMSSPCRQIEFSPAGRRLGALAEAESGGGSELYLWTVDYQIPASGCFTSRIRLTSTNEPVIGPGTQPGSVQSGKTSPGTGTEIPLVAAIVPFTAIGEDADLGCSAAHFLESALAGNRRLKLIERARVDELISELKLQQSGLVDKSTAVELGKLLGARLIITGNLDRAGSDLVVSARIIEVQTGEILGTRQVHCGQCGADDIFDAVELLAGVLVAE